MLAGGVSSVAEEERPASAGQTLLARSLAYHDPDGLWERSALQFELKTSSADGRESAVRVGIDTSQGFFQLLMERRGDTVQVEGRGGSVTASVNGAATFPDEMREKHRLADGGGWWRDYYSYLLGLPMKLRDPGTLLDPEPKQTLFQGQAVLALRVTYEATVGTDTWYFYFEPTTARLVGCRFFHDEKKNDGEYIVFEEEVQAGRLRLPRQRKWYTNAESEFLGTDSIESVEIQPR